MGRLGAAACQINRGAGRQKALQPIGKPVFCLSPFGFLAGKQGVIERLEAPLKVAACRASSRVRGNRILQGFAGLAARNRAKCFGFRTRTGVKPTARRRHQSLQKVVFVPAAHLSWSISFVLHLDGVCILPSQRMAEGNSTRAW
jgi:hypothetical protein